MASQRCYLALADGSSNNNIGGDGDEVVSDNPEKGLETGGVGNCCGVTATAASPPCTPKPDPEFMTNGALGE